MELTSWDWFVLVIGLFSVGFGVWRGMIRTVFGLLGWVAALFGTPLLIPVLASYVTVENTWLLAVPVFIGILIVVRIVGGLVSRSLGKAGLGGVDRLLGALIGIARAAIVVAIVAVIAKQFGWHEQAAWKLSATRPLLDSMIFWIEPLLPERLSGIQKA
jgi:membrane protein required for colicin V production